MEVVTVLLNQVWKIISTLYNGWTALQLATMKNHYDAAKILLPGEKKLKTSMKRIGVDLSLAAGHYSILQLLLKYNPNLEAKNENDEKPLFRAVDYYHHDLALLLQR